MTQPLKNLLNNSTEFRAILGKAQHLRALQEQLITATPAYLTPTLQVLSMEFGTLTVATGNATVAAKLRQLAPEIVANLKNGGSGVSGIRVKVQVSYPAPPGKKKVRQLSRVAQTSIEELSNSLADSPLKDALKKMSGR